MLSTRKPHGFLFFGEWGWGRAMKGILNGKHMVIKCLKDSKFEIITMLSIQFLIAIPTPNLSG